MSGDSGREGGGLEFLRAYLENNLSVALTTAPCQAWDPSSQHRFVHFLFRSLGTQTPCRQQRPSQAIA
jgi:hypothetical protein